MVGRQVSSIVKTIQGNKLVYGRQAGLFNCNKYVYWLHWAFLSSVFQYGIYVLIHIIVATHF